MDHTIPKGTKCESCGMLAEFVEKDEHGAVHYYCSHHRQQVSGVGDQVSSTSHHVTPSGSPLHKGEKVLDKHAGHTTNMFKTRFWVCLILTVPILAYAEIVQRVLGVRIPAFPGHMYLILALASVIFFYGGWVFIKGALAELKHRLPGMMTLIALAITVAYVYSVVVTFIPVGEPLFWEIATLITIMLLGHWIEMAAVGHASGALRELAKLLPDTAERFHNPSQPPLISDALRDRSPTEASDLRGGDQTNPPLKIRGDGGVMNDTETVLVGELRMGDLVLVRPGAKVPADGEISEGVSSVNESMITGESRPVEKRAGSSVIAGAVNGEGVLKVRVTKIGENTALAGIMRLVAQAQASRSRVQALADRAAFYLTFVAVGVGAATTVVWLALDAGAAVALTRTVAVLVIACPHALGLAVPLVASISTTLSARSGILVREKLALELARKIDVVLFDKTGTLTKGEYGVTDIIVNEELRMKNEELLALAAAVDRESEHPVAKAIVKAAQERGMVIPQATEVKALPGRGVEGLVEGRKVLVGGENLVREFGVEQGQSLSARTVLAATQGKTVVYVVAEKEVVGAFGVADVIRQESKEAVEALHKMGVRVAMVTGDAKPVAEWVAKEIGIDEYFAEVLPEEKVEIVRSIQQQVPPLRVRGGEGELRAIHNPSPPPLILRGGERRVVAMVGDGINDAPALTAADVGIAIGAGTDVAIESAGIILIKNDPRDIVRIIKLARATYRKMVENLIWATGYNTFAIPAAAGAFLPWGVILAPAFAAILMSASTVIVAFNAQLLRRVRL